MLDAAIGGIVLVTAFVLAVFFFWNAPWLLLFVGAAIVLFVTLMKEG